MAEKHNGYGIKAGFLMCLVCVLAQIGQVTGAEPAQRRVGRKTKFFSEIPLATTYANGNMWTGWAGRWTDALLLVDREAGFPPNIYYRVTTKSMMTTLSEMKSYKLDGAIFNADRPALVDRIDEAKAMGGLPAMYVPSLQLRKLNPADRDYRRAMATVPKVLKNPHGWYVNGKPVFVSWWEDRFFEPEAMAKRLKELRAEIGDFLYVTDLSRLCGWANQSKWHRGEYTEADAEEMRTIIRNYLRAADGVYFGEYHGLVWPVDGEKVLDIAYLREVIYARLREVLSEPEFANSGKILGCSAGLGHGNPYSFGLNCGQDGTRTLRDSTLAALELNPDFINYFEWDEYNENTLLKPTILNSFAVKRILRSLISEARCEPNLPLEGDDTAIPNLILSYRKTLTPGELAVFEILSVPEDGATGAVSVRLDLKGIDGTVVRSYMADGLDLSKMDERRFRAASEDWCAYATLVPELTVMKDGVARTYRGFTPFDLRPIASWDHKWMTMPLRDLASGATCTLAIRDTADRGVFSAHISAESAEEIDRVELDVNGQHVYSKGAEFDDFRSTETEDVFSITTFLRGWTRDLHARGVFPRLTVNYVTNATWRIADKTVHGLSATVNDEAHYTPDTYLRLSRKETPNAVLSLEWPTITNLTVRLGDVVRDDGWAAAGPSNFTFAVARFYGFNEYGPAAGTNTVSADALVRTDLPVSVVSAYLVTKSGKMFRSEPVVLGERGAERLCRVYSAMKKSVVEISLGMRQLPDLAWDFSMRNGVIAKAGSSLLYDGVLGAIPFVAVRRNRGGSSFYHGHPEFYRQPWSLAPEHRTEAGTDILRFSRDGQYFAMPWGVVPRYAAYRLTFEFRPEDANASQVIFATGTSNIYGPVGFIKTEKGLLKGTLCGTYNDDTSIVAKGRVRGGEWNRVELIWRVDTVELVLNGESNGCRPCVCPGRVGTAAWFGGRKSGGLFRGDLRNVRVSYE